VNVIFKIRCHFKISKNSWIWRKKIKISSCQSMVFSSRVMSGSQGGPCDAPYIWVLWKFSGESL